ncbi:MULTISPECIES: hypothetical protein [unclassified Streptomyces]|uniref:hypothetical protein n=1 Tax=unclassified Streptomyces TaxID=2593676 RepID=UPI0005ECB976|nr:MULTISPECIES: hypothetical protein [unclassified Streptomyces]APU41273.1 hypothetical protein BSL84_17430 [Streptomyces sp. TN58]KJK42326.1 hypothetical protein UK14_32030 [Streptomyces sp. NRRL F-4428]
MNPSTHAALYGPWRPARPARRERPAVVALAGLLWAVTALSVAWTGGLACVALLWTAAAGEPAVGLVAPLLLIPAGAAGITALARAPRVRDLAASTRMLLLGAVACPVPTALAVWLWAVTG